MDELEKILKCTFLDEAEQMLQDCEHCFLELEQDPSNSSVIEKIFRLAHSFKGSAGAAGFDELASFAHHLETLLAKIKGGELLANRGIVSLLLRANDELNRMIVSLRGNPSTVFGIDNFVAEIELALNGGLAETKVAADEKTDVTENIESDELERVTKSPTKKKTTALASGDESLRVNLRRIDDLVNDVGELVILQAVLFQHRHELSSGLLQKTISQLEKITRKVQDTSMGLRLVPLKQTFQKMQRIVRDSAQALGKEIKLTMVGDETEIDKTILDLLSDPLVHLIRNAVDHGVEDTTERTASGKATAGNIWLRAYHRGECLVVEIEDDGKGLNKDKLVAKAKNLGILAETAEPTEEEAFQLIFASGFSTKEQVTAISGRGVGMDVVKTHVEQLQGRIEIVSKLGKGSCFRVILPLTLAIVDGMIVRSEDERFVIPISAITESLRPRPEDISWVTGHGAFLNVRGVTMQMSVLSEMLGRKVLRKEKMDGIAVVGSKRDGSPFAVMVDDIIGQQQIVIKRLGDELQNQIGISGAAILGDGRASLIIDMPELVQTYVPKSPRPNPRKEAA